MKTLQLFSFLTLFTGLSLVSFAQDVKTETIAVSGNCGMCKSNIEKAAKKAGASAADWDVEAKQLTVKYNTSATNAAKIQQQIAAAGYDTRDVRGDDAAYNKLHACCKYERAAATKTSSACASTCEMKDGKCVNMAVCKEKGCCKDETDGKEKSCCSTAKTSSSATAEQDKAACCKGEGKMAAAGTKEGKEKSCCSAAH